MIKAIIFDVGGVYMQGSFVDFVNQSRQILGINETFYVDKLIVFDKRYNSGEISIEECFRSYFGVEINDDQMKQIINVWTNTWKPTPEMIDLVINLKKNYRLAILSNSDPVNSENYTRLGWYQYFDPIILSHEVHLLKPDKRIYEITLEKLGLKPEECLFIDDQADCLVPAADMGMSVIQFRSVPQLKAELDALLSVK